jgi:CDGSH-type Zn-finger protein
MSTDTVVRVAYLCPSGAIQFDRKDGGPEEEAPPINAMNLRENGPYAFRAPMSLAGEPIGFRATLCRCGASGHKPFCDGSHNAIGFVATGEPETRNTQMLAVRDGPIAVAPERNGPLVVTGNLEICSGTGRVIDRVTRARLCRCGASRTKPFCDNTHVRIGFVADGG